jgi:DNA polymerase III subunit beta
MNLSEITCIALGMIFNVFTFVLGVAVGVNVSASSERTLPMATATKTKDSSTTLTIPRETLLHAVAAAGRAVVGAKSPKPILRNVRIGDGLVTGTDLELRIDVAIAEHCEAFLVPAERLLAILRSSSADEVTLTAGKTSVTVRCGLGSWTLPTEDPLEYPVWEPADLAAVARLPADQFARAAKATIYATDNESSRFALGGVLLEVKGGDPTFVATDGRRLSLVETETDQAVDDRLVIVPSRVMVAAAGMATGDGSVQIEANAHEVRFRAGRRDAHRPADRGTLPEVAGRGWRARGGRYDA